MIEFLDVGYPNRAVSTQLGDAYNRVMDSDYFILGPELEAFESELALAEGADFAVGVGTGPDALALILQARDVGPGDEVIVPSNTCIATWLAVSQVGAIPVPVEPRDGTCNINPERIEAAITSKTVAIVPVHLYGQPAEMTEIRSIADRYSLAVVADGAQSIGASYLGRPVAEFADATALSFYPGKNLGALGDGGAVLTSDPKLGDEVRRLRNYGSSVKYVHEERGTNSRLDEMQAAFLRAKLPDLAKWNDRRSKIANQYMEALEPLDIRCVDQIDQAKSAWHLFVVRHKERDRLRELLAEEEVETLIHYPRAPSKQGAYPEFADLSLPIAEAQSQQVFSLPIGPHLARGDVETVIDALQVVLDRV